MQEPTPSNSASSFNSNLILDILEGIVAEHPESPIENPQIAHLQEQINQILVVNQLQAEQLARQSERLTSQSHRIIKLE